MIHWGGWEGDAPRWGAPTIKIGRTQRISKMDAGGLFPAHVPAPRTERFGIGPQVLVLLQMPNQCSPVKIRFMEASVVSMRILCSPVKLRFMSRPVWSPCVFLRAEHWSIAVGLVTPPTPYALQRSECSGYGGNFARGDRRMRAGTEMVSGML